MYKQLCNNFHEYLKLNKQDLCHDDYKLALLEPLYGICSIDTYEKWKDNSDMRYYEASNLIYHLNQNHQSTSVYTNLIQELCNSGFDSIGSQYFSIDNVNEQLKLISYLLESERFSATS